MQVLQAGRHKLILLEIDAPTVSAVAQQAGFETKLKESPRSILLDLIAEQRDTPLLLFDAADPANLGWFSRCQFYVDGRTGGVMQTPMTVANKRDRAGRNIAKCASPADLERAARHFPSAGQTAHDRAGLLRHVEQLPASADSHGSCSLRRRRRTAAGWPFRSPGLPKLAGLINAKLAKYINQS